MSEPGEDEETHGGLGLTVYAELTARLRAGEARGAALERRALTEEQWRVAKREWTRAIDDEIGRGEDRLVVAFAAELERARDELAAQAAPPVSSAAPVAVPSFLVEQAAPRPSFLVGAPEPPRAAPPAPQQATYDDEERTAYAPAPQAPAPLLPFAPAPEPAPPARASAPGDAPPESIGSAGSSRRAPPSARGFGPPPDPWAAQGAPPGAAGETQAIRVPKGVAAPALTLEQYASLVVELDLAPQQRPHTLARYRLAGDEAFFALEMSFQRRFGAEPGLLGRFAELVKQYRQWRLSGR